MNPEAIRQLLALRPFEPDPETEFVRWTSLTHVVSVRRKQTALPA
jgi:hypothetical protein